MSKVSDSKTSLENLELTQLDTGSAKLASIYGAAFTFGCWLTIFASQGRLSAKTQNSIAKYETFSGNEV